MNKGGGQGSVPHSKIVMKAGKNKNGKNPKKGVDN